MYPAEAITDRVAVQDMVIPLMESITTSTGERISRIPVRKGQVFVLAIGSYQRLASFSTLLNEFMQRWSIDSGRAGVRMHTSLSRPVGSMVWRARERQWVLMPICQCILLLQLGSHRPPKFDL
jgi:hypothetical protein